MKVVFYLFVSFFIVAIYGYANNLNTPCNTYGCFEKLEESFDLNEQKNQITFTESYKQKIQKIDETIKEIRNKEKALSQNSLKQNIKSKPKKEEKVLNDYKTALLYFKEKKFQNAYELFNKLFQNNLNDVNINFYLGRSAFELKKYREALLAFDRVLFETPDASRVKLEMGKTHMMLKEFKEAKKYFTEVKTDPKVPVKISKAVSKLLVIIDKKIQKNFLNGVAIFGLNYDSNIYTRSDIEIFDDITLFDGFTLDMNNTTPDEDDWAHQEIVMLNHKYIYNDKITFKNDLMYFMKTLFDSKNSSLDIKLASYTPSIDYTYNQKILLNLSFYTDQLWIDDKISLKTYVINPKITFTHNEFDSFNGSLKLQKKNNTSQASKKDNTYYVELMGAWNRTLSKVWSLNSSITLEKESLAKNHVNSLKTKDMKSSKVVLSPTYIYSQQFTMNPSLSYKIKKLDNVDESVGFRTQDKELKFSLMNTYIYSKNWMIQVGGDYTKQTSNDSRNEYSKHTLTFNLIRPF